MANGTIHVCALSALPRVVAASGARHLVSLINADMLPATPAGLDPQLHLKLIMNDISSPRDGLIAPGTAHVEQLVTFLTAWDRETPLVIHCWAGISRSSAAAFIALAALRPDVDEMVLARTIRAASRTATPNQRLVEIADTRLRRDGRMVNAIVGIGRGETAMEGAPYVLNLTSLDPR